MSQAALLHHPPSRPTGRLAGRTAPRVVLLQTQAEAAGAQEISRLLAAGLAARGCDVDQLFLFRRTDAFDGDPHAIFCAADRPRTPRQLLVMFARLHRELRRLRPDVVILFQHYGNLIGGVFARAAGVPVVIANQNGLMDILSPAVIGLDRLFGRLGIFSRIVVNSSTTEAEYRNHPRAYRRRLVRIDHGFGEKRSRLGRAEARDAFGFGRDDVILGCVARLHPNKQLDAAIRLLPGNPGWRLALAGQGSARDSLERLAADLGCADRVSFAGELAPERVADFLAALDVFVFPTVSETFGLAAVEAAQAGIPVVANALPVLADILSHEGRPAALFADARDTAAFGAAVRRILDEPTLAGALTSRGARLRDRFPLDAMVDAYEALVRERHPVPTP